MHSVPIQCSSTARAVPLSLILTQARTCTAPLACDEEVFQRFPQPAGKPASRPGGVADRGAERLISSNRQFCGLKYLLL